MTGWGLFWFLAMLGAFGVMPALRTVGRVLLPPFLVTPNMRRLEKSDTVTLLTVLGSIVATLWALGG